MQEICERHRVENFLRGRGCEFGEPLTPLRTGTTVTTSTPLRCVLAAGGHRPYRTKTPTTPKCDKPLHRITAFSGPPL